MLWIRDADTLQWTYLSPAFENIYGLSRDEALRGDTMRNWLDLVVPEDRDRARAEIEKARAGERVTFEYRITRPSDGEVRLLRNTDFPIRDKNGRVARIGGVGHDATDEQAAAERLHVLVLELQHRTRNLMGVVQSVTNRTLEGSTSLEDFGGRIRDRLGALARVNGLLSRLSEGDRITFDELIRTELKGHGVIDGHDHGPQVSLRGPRGLRLRSSQVQTLALGLHELATNALKYGALSRPEGRLDIAWALVPGPEGTRRLRVEWRESGVALAGPEGAGARHGYGRELIERALPYQLQAETAYELTPQGVRCTITLPLSSNHAGKGPLPQDEDA
ncbi:sensor histidine kinase [Paracoccus shandongensis]|uniref:sensor histidine kinase n=1 Tax=Paracoccus shandongensis TaxID=2816048 RepID=UPI0030136197